MEDQMRAAFEAWFSEGGTYPRAIGRSSEGGYILQSAAGSWIAWQAAWQEATAQCSARNDEQMQRLRTSLTRLLEVDKQLQDLLPRKVD